MPTKQIWQLCAFRYLVGVPLSDDDFLMSHGSAASGWCTGERMNRDLLDGGGREAALCEAPPGAHETTKTSKKTECRKEAAVHTLRPQEALRALAAETGGLSSAEAARRFAKHGPNRLPEPPRRSPATAVPVAFPQCADLRADRFGRGHGSALSTGWIRA